MLGEIRSYTLIDRIDIMISTSRSTTKSVIYETLFDDSTKQMFKRCTYQGKSQDFETSGILALRKLYMSMSDDTEKHIITILTKHNSAYL